MKLKQNNKALEFFKKAINLKPHIVEILSSELTPLKNYYNFFKMIFFSN